MAASLTSPVDPDPEILNLELPSHTHNPFPEIFIHEHLLISLKKANIKQSKSYRNEIAKKLLEWD